MWDVAWEELMALELAKAGCRQPSHLLLHLKSFKRLENFVRVIKCNVGEESEDTESQATKICSVVRRVWKAYKFDMKTLVLKVVLCKSLILLKKSLKLKSNVRLHIHNSDCVLPV